MEIAATAALAVLFVTSGVLYIFGRRFSRRFVALNRAMPPLTWMFRRTDDEELESARRSALLTLQVAVVAFAAYLLLS